VREIFRRARSASPSIIFFVRFSRFALLRIQISAQDEIDALASSRSPAAVDGGTHEGVLLSLLNEMDGVEELIGVTVIGATNRPEALVSCPFPCCTASSPHLILKCLCQDPAVIRPGRLDRILYVGPPNFTGRVDIFRIRTRNMAVDPALDLDALATLVRPLSLVSPNLKRDFHRRVDARAQKSRPYARRQR
jgi:AAA family ATPase